MFLFDLKIIKSINYLFGKDIYLLASIQVNYQLYKVHTDH